MHNKLDIEIELGQRYVSDGFFNEYKQILDIKVNSLDQRFQVFNVMKSNELFIGKNGLRILSTLDLPNGAVYDKAFVLPSPRNVGRMMYCEFMYDFERKEYLEKLYFCLQDWSEHWWGFHGDSQSRMVVYDNRWVIECGKPNEIFMSMSEEEVY